MNPPRLRRCRRWAAGACLALGLLAGNVPAWAGTSLQLIGNGLAPTEVAASRQLLDDALQRLPTRWAGSLDPRIRVEWRDDLPDDVHGRIRGHRLLLDRRLLDAMVDDPSARQAALATVIHELAHFHDRSREGRLSSDPRLLDLAGWQVSPMRLGLRNPRNALSDRSPDPYELDSPAEFVAVNLEYFLLDPAYACRRPALYRHFAAHFDSEPASASCAGDFAYLQAPVDGDTPPLLQLDPGRVYQVDYLLAEPDERVMSRWGHSMLRLVICAPGRPPGPDCRLDLRHHRVLSFRAFVDDVQISSWRGLTGSYPSRLFVLPLDQVIEEYTRVELRGLQSIPLDLRRGEIAALLERAARLHWSYDGRYYFLSNNCAVETFKLLHDGVPRLADANLSSITPTGLLRKLERAGIADASVLDDNDEALRIGYRFEAMSAYYQAMFEVARDSLGLPQDSVRDWLDMPAEQRSPWLQRTDLRVSAALLLLEQAALRREELLARDELKRRFLGRHATDVPADTDVGSDAARVKLHELLQLEGDFSRPAALLRIAGTDSSYGLPQSEERARLAGVGAIRAEQWREQRSELHRLARQWLPASRQADLAAVEANIEALGDRLRLLHGQESGLRLGVGG